MSYFDHQASRAGLPGHAAKPAPIIVYGRDARTEFAAHRQIVRTVRK